MSGANALAPPPHPSKAGFGWMLVGIGVFLLIAGVALLVFLTTHTPLTGRLDNIAYLLALDLIVIGVVSPLNGRVMLRTGRQNPALRGIMLVFLFGFLGLCLATQEN